MKKNIIIALLVIAYHMPIFSQTQSQSPKQFYLKSPDKGMMREYDSKNYKIIIPELQNMNDDQVLAHEQPLDLKSLGKNQYLPETTQPSPEKMPYLDPPSHFTMPIKEPDLLRFYMPTK
jgi:hypothetical protein